MKYKLKIYKSHYHNYTSIALLSLAILNVNRNLAVATSCDKRP